MGEATIERPGVLTQWQDRGRGGLAYYGIPPSGPMDERAADLANVLLGNRASEPVIECHLTAPVVRFETSATICVTGSDMQWEVDDRPIDRQETFEISAGSILAGSATRHGCRAYIGIRGEIETQQTFGSAACCEMAGFGGNNGNVFQPGDRIRWKDVEALPADVRVEVLRESVSEAVLFDIVPGPEFEWLDEASQQAIREQSFFVTSSGNRMGVRVTGPKLSTSGKSLSHSVPVLPGMIQLPPSGEPIVVLQDGQTTGGYPRIAYVTRLELDRLNQLRPGQSFRLRVVE